MIKTKCIIFQIFDTRLTNYDFPYPPLYQEKDAEYWCFTDKENIHSKFWKIIYMDRISEQCIWNEYLCGYHAIEIKTNEIQVGSLVSEKPDANALVEVPDIRSIPGISLDLTQIKPTTGKNGEYIYSKPPIYQNGKYGGRPYLLTIGMPVSNQVETIERCLLSVKPLLDNLDAELLIINTGSEDGTIDICKKYGARIVNFTWCNDMSAARNQGIYNAMGEWYMSLDADEWFDDVSELLDFFKSGNYKNYDAASYIQRNYIYSTGGFYDEIIALRLAKITDEVHFEGRIHDALHFKEDAVLYQSKAFVHHYGFVVDQPEKKLSKFKRNVKHLLYDVYEYPDNLRYILQLAQEFHAVTRNIDAYNFCILGLAVEKELTVAGIGSRLVVLMIAALAYDDSEKIFSIHKLFEHSYEYSDAEKAFTAYSLATVMFTRNRENKTQIQEYLRYYWYWLNEYKKNPEINKLKTFKGLHVCINEAYITDSYIIAFVCACQSKDYLNAECYLNKIEYESVIEKQELLVREMFEVPDSLFKKMLDKLTVVQAKQWISEIMDEWLLLIEHRNYSESCWERSRQLFSKLSVKDIQKYTLCKHIGLSVEAEDNIVLDILRHDFHEENVQSLYMYCILLHNYILKNTDNDSRVFRFYIDMKGYYLEVYYNGSVTGGISDGTVSSEEKAIYLIYRTIHLNNDAAYLGALKEALTLFPTYNKQIQLLLQKYKEEHLPEEDEMKLLANQVKNNIRVLIQAGKSEDAYILLKELEQICPGDMDVEILRKELKTCYNGEYS